MVIEQQQGLGSADEGEGNGEYDHEGHLDAVKQSHQSEKGQCHGKSDGECHFPRRVFELLHVSGLFHGYRLGRMTTGHQQGSHKILGLSNIPLKPFSILERIRDAAHITTHYPTDISNISKIFTGFGSSKKSCQGSAFFTHPGSKPNRRMIGSLHFWINDLMRTRPHDVVVLPFWVHGVNGLQFY